ncbi:SNF2-related protein [Psychrobacter pygoscelis]|uniref:SNF2-related protein n=1 Tax=Psychrobacter pygoscelis TaxID=2488563 RepID=UPI00103EEE24|nr:DEAD/DEAH box helicase [Psychrobacter pygoscelis]
MRKEFIPRPYQHIALEHILSEPRCALWASMGMGKTSTCLTAIDALQFVEPDPVLVLAPKRVAVSTWPDEAEKWKHLKDLKVTAITGTANQRKALLKADSNVFTTNYEQLPWLVEHFGKRWPFKTVIADESTRLKSYRSRGGSKRARALAKVAHSHTTRFIELTGTPSPNGLIDLWGQAYFLDGGERLGYSFTSFKNRWFQSIQVGAQRFAVRLEPHDFAQEQIQERLSDICLTLDANDYFDIDKPIITDVYVDLPAKARKLYEAMEKEMFFELRGDEVEAMNAAAKTIKCLQIANGAVYTDDGWHGVHDAKLEALESIIEESAGMPVLVAYHFKTDLIRLQKAFKQGRVLDQDPQTIRDWNAGKIPVLFAHPASAGHGLNLQDGGNILVIFGHWWNLEEYQQIVERIGPTRQAQAGHKRPVFIYHLVACDTVDDLIIERRETKRRVQDILLNAMKRS